MNAMKQSIYNNLRKDNELTSFIVKSLIYFSMDNNHRLPILFTDERYATKLYKDLRKELLNYSFIITGVDKYNSDDKDDTSKINDISKYGATGMFTTYSVDTIDYSRRINTDYIISGSKKFNSIWKESLHNRICNIIADYLLNSGKYHYLYILQQTSKTIDLSIIEQWVFTLLFKDVDNAYESYITPSND